VASRCSDGRTKAGLGSAYREGFKLGLAQGYEALVEMDADLSTTHPSSATSWPSSAAAPTWPSAPATCPAGRSPTGPGTAGDLPRGNVYAQRMLGLAARDATSGYRAYHRRALERINLTAVRADGYGFQVEMAYKGRPGRRDPGRGADRVP